MNIEQTLREYLSNVVHMSLATSRDNKPWVCEVHFAYDDNLNLYFRSLTSRRHSQEIADNASVAGNIVKQHFIGEPGVGVYFEGSACLLPEGEQRNQAARCIIDRLQADGSILEQANQSDGHQFYMIAVDTFYVFGKFDTPSGQKYELAWNGGKK